MSLINNICCICDNTNNIKICPCGKYYICNECLIEGLKSQLDLKNSLKCPCKNKHPITFTYIMYHMELFDIYISNIKYDYNKFIDYLKYYLLKECNLSNKIQLLNIILKNIKLGKITNNIIEYIINNNEDKNYFINDFTNKIQLQYPEITKNEINNIFELIINYIKKHQINNSYYILKNVKKLYNKLIKKYVDINKLNNKFETYFYEDNKFNINIIHCNKGLCKGFLIEKENYFECILCKTKFCKICLCEYTENHNTNTCNLNDDINIYQGLKENETIEDDKDKIKFKLCPNCHKLCTKTNGCDDTLCTNCNTTFKWSTLIIKQNSTNELYENMKKEGIVNDTLNKYNRINLDNTFRTQYEYIPIRCEEIKDLLDKNNYIDFNNDFLNKNKIILELNKFYVKYKSLYSHNIQLIQIIECILYSLIDTSIITYNFDNEIDKIYKQYIFEYNYNKIIKDFIINYTLYYIDNLIELKLLYNIIKDSTIKTKKDIINKFNDNTKLYQLFSQSSFNNIIEKNNNWINKLNNDFINFCYNNKKSKLKFSNIIKTYYIPKFNNFFNELLPNDLLLIFENYNVKTNKFYYNNNLDSLQII